MSSRSPVVSRSGGLTELQRVDDSAAQARAALDAVDAEIVFCRREYGDAVAELIEERLAELRQAVAHLDKQRAVLADSLDADDLTLYTDLAGRLTPAVARVDSGVCVVCNAAAPSLRDPDEIVQCTCSRILVR